MCTRSWKAHEGECYYIGDQSFPKTPGVVWKGKEPCGRSQASPGEAAWRPGGEAGPPDHEELADSLAFILRAVGRAGNQRERRAIPLAAAGRAQGKRASLLGLGAG